MTDYSDSPDYRAILAGICDDPAADLPRLVLADYLDERGDEAGAARAEFVRLGCELAAKPRVRGDYLWCRSVDLTDPNTLAFVTGFTGQFGVNSLTGPTPRCRCANCRLLRRERDLVARWRTDWDGEVLAPLVAAGLRIVRCEGDDPQRFCAFGVGRSFSFFDGTLHYSRGFVSRLTVPAAAFAEYGAALLEAAPIEVVAFPDAVGGSTRVTVRPPGEDRCWRAYFSRSEDAGDFDAGGWRTRGELAAGISAVVEPLPRRPGTAGVNCGHTEG